MSGDTYQLVILAGLLFVLWAMLRLRRRTVEGNATVVERRFESALRKFDVHLDAFKFAPQASVKVLLNHDHVVSTEIERLFIDQGNNRERLRLRVHRYLEEIVPFFKPLAYYKIGYFVSNTFLKFLYKIDSNPQELNDIKAKLSSRPCSVIYLLNHRSNVDYVVAPYVLKDNVALSFAVGEWARVWPLEYLFKCFGSYFLRRGCRDELYHTVLRRYVQVVTKNAVTQALFPEGGLSRDGLLRAPKIGLLDSILCSKEDRSFSRELIFVPVGINYDRVLEDRVLVFEGKSEQPKLGKLAMLRRVFSILFGNIWKFTRNKIRKNGIASVRFGEPVSFDEWHATRGVDIFSLNKYQRRQHVGEFCNHMMDKIAEVIPATPLCIVAKALLECSPTSFDELVKQTQLEIDKLHAKEVTIVSQNEGAQWMVEGALLRFSMRHLIEQEDDQIHIHAPDLPVIQYYANAIMHYETGEVPQVETPSYAQTIDGQPEGNKA